MMIWRSCILLLLAMSWGTVAVSAAPQFRFWKAIETNSVATETIAGLRVDSDMYSATRDQLPDCRILDDRGTETPFQLEVMYGSYEEKARENLPATVVNAREEDNTLELQIRFPQEAHKIEGLRIVTRLSDFERQVQVAGSIDGTEWKPLVTDATIFDYARYIDLKQLEITLPDNDFRHFKLTIGDVVDQRVSMLSELERTLRQGAEFERTERTAILQRAFKIDRIEGWHTVTRTGARRLVEQDYPVADFHVEQAGDKKQTMVTVKTRREPITRLTLEVSTRNFSRRCQVQTLFTTKKGSDWQTWAEATISRFNLGRLQREATSISIPVDRKGQYRIVIQNEDNPPLDITGVKATGQSQQLLFLAAPERKYRLFYGSEVAASPKYETAAVLAAARTDGMKPAEMKLGPQQANSDYTGDVADEHRPLLDQPWFLGVVVAVMVAVLGWTLFRAVKKLDKLPS